MKYSAQYQTLATLLASLKHLLKVATKVRSASSVLACSCFFLDRIPFFASSFAHPTQFFLLQIQIIQTTMSNLPRPVKTLYSPFQVKQSKLCHWLIVLKLNIQFIIMRTFQTSNKSNFAMSFWMIRWNLGTIKQLVEMALEYFQVCR